LQSNARDEEARSKVESVNAKLRKFNHEHGYPTLRVITLPDIPKPLNPSPPISDSPKAAKSQSGASPASETQNKGRTRTKEGPAKTTKILTIEEKEGYVLNQGVEKEISGHNKAGYGHQLLLRTDGKHDLDIYDLVRASKFGRNYVKTHQAALDGMEIKTGGRESLRGKNIDKLLIGGAASVRRYQKSRPEDGWEREVATITIVRFDESSEFTWKGRPRERVWARGDRREGQSLQEEGRTDASDPTDKARNQEEAYHRQCGDRIAKSTTGQDQ
jgi:hypothetical protein